MSANNGNSDSCYPAQFSSFASRRSAEAGMDLPHSRSSPQLQLNAPSAPHSSSMSTLAMRTSSALPSPRYMFWEDTRPLELSSRPMSPIDRTERIELPSIRKAIPEIQLRKGRGTGQECRTDTASYSISTGPGALITPPEYVQTHSLHKRRRLSSDADDDVESRDHIVPRIYRSSTRPSRTQNAAISPTTSARRASAFSSADSWSNSTRTSPYLPTQGLTGIRSSPPFDSLTRCLSEWRPTLPSLPSLTFERGPPQAPRGRSNWDEYGHKATHSGAQTYSPVATSLEPSTSSHHPSSTSHGYLQTRGQSHSGPSSLSLDRTPFSASSHHRHSQGHPADSYLYGMDINDGSDGKQRKRRGNLPKETTDKLRAWFLAHLQHPYPTEDEKQELMRQTGLQMNQISNWFINARRRQLPAMINSARAESDARSACVGDRDEAIGEDRDDRDKRAALPLGDSDGEGSGYEDEYDRIAGSLPRHTVQGQPKRERI